MLVPPGIPVTLLVALAVVGAIAARGAEDIQPVSLSRSVQDKGASQGRAVRQDDAPGGGRRCPTVSGGGRKYEWNDSAVVASLKS
jgi:hypothetical protein